MQIINSHQLANLIGTSNSSFPIFFTQVSPLLNNNVLLACIIIDISCSEMLQTVLAKLMVSSSSLSDIEKFQCEIQKIMNYFYYGFS